MCISLSLLIAEQIDNSGEVVELASRLLVVAVAAGFLGEGTTRGVQVGVARFNPLSTRGWMGGARERYSRQRISTDIYREVRLCDISLKKVKERHRFSSIIPQIRLMIGWK